MPKRRSVRVPRPGQAKKTHPPLSQVLRSLNGRKESTTAKLATIIANATEVPEGEICEPHLLELPDYQRATPQVQIALERLDHIAEYCAKAQAALFSKKTPLRVVKKLIARAQEMPGLPRADSAMIFLEVAQSVAHEWEAGDVLDPNGKFTDGEQFDALRNQFVKTAAEFFDEIPRAFMALPDGFGEKLFSLVAAWNRNEHRKRGQSKWDLASELLKMLRLSVSQPESLEKKWERWRQENLNSDFI